MTMLDYKESWRQGFRRVSSYVLKYRQLTGTPQYRHAYVYEDNQVVSACSHRHRSDKAAMACADRMVNALLKIERAKGTKTS